jgi:TnpA family transposase
VANFTFLRRWAKIAILRPHEHSTDTHGVSEQLFGLCYLLGYSFMPRLRDLADQQLYRVDPESPPESLGPLLRAGLDLSLLCEQWDQPVGVAACLRNRAASAHIVLQRLANASPADRVAKALTTWGVSSRPSRSCATFTTKTSGGGTRPVT